MNFIQCDVVNEKCVQGQHLWQCELVHVALFVFLVPSKQLGSNHIMGTMSETTDNFQHVFKLLLVGDTGVGKSALLLRFTQDR